MEIIKGEYFQQNTGKVENVEVLIIQNKEKYYQGIDLNKMSLSNKMKARSIVLGKNENNVNLKELFLFTKEYYSRYWKIHFFSFQKEVI